MVQKRLSFLKDGLLYSVGERFVFDSSLFPRHRRLVGLPDASPGEGDEGTGVDCGIYTP